MRGQGGGQKHSPGCFINAYRNQCNLPAYSLHLSLTILFTVFSLNFSSVGKEPFMASKAKNAPETTLSLGGGEGGVVERGACPCTCLEV